MISRKYSVHFLLHCFLMMFLMLFILGCAAGDSDHVTDDDVYESYYGNNGDAGSYHAMGAWSYNSGTNDLSLHWIGSNYPCNGPEAGTSENKTATITDTQMVWENMTWTRSSGEADNPVGSWTATSEEGTFVLELRSNGSMIFDGKINECSN